MFFGEKISNCKNTKMVWDVFNEIMSKKKDNGQVNELLVNNVQITDDYEMAENFNDFFSTVGTNIANSLPEVNIDPMQYVVNHENIPSLQFEQIGPVFVSDVIKSFAPKKKYRYGWNEHVCPQVC
jgi:hypothetical protein